MTAVITVEIAAVLVQAMDSRELVRRVIWVEPMPISHHHRTVGEVAEHQQDDREPA